MSKKFVYHNLKKKNILRNKFNTNVMIIKQTFLTQINSIS